MPRRGSRRPARGSALDRRPLRRVAALLCLLLAFYCLVAATATLYAQTVPGEPDPKKLPESPTSRLPLLIPLIFLAFVVVLAAVVRRRRRPPARRAGSTPGRTLGRDSRDTDTVRRLKPPA